MFSESERAAVRNLFKILDSNAIVELVLPVEGNHGIGNPLIRGTQDHESRYTDAVGNART